MKHIKAQAEEIDDVGFISQIVDEFIKNGDANPARIYATGISNGGFMSNRLACELADKMAAVAIVTATMPVNMVSKCNPSEPVSVLIMNGTEDPLVPYNGGEVRLFKKGKSRGEIVSTADTFDFWLSQAGYKASAQTIKPFGFPDVDIQDNTRVFLQKFKGQNAEVALYTIEGGGHSWPGGRQYLFEFLIGRTSHDINATEHIWDFFKRNPKR